MKPETWELIKNQLHDNIENMENCEEDGTYNEMQIENETMEWFCKSEGRSKSFDRWSEQCLKKVEANEK